MFEKNLVHRNLLKFIKEDEFKFKMRHLNAELKIKELFDVYLFLKNVGELENNNIIANEDIYLDSD